jgi:hypothetical protein
LSLSKRLGALTHSTELRVILSLSKDEPVERVSRLLDVESAATESGDDAHRCG